MLVTVHKTNLLLCPACVQCADNYTQEKEIVFLFLQPKKLNLGSCNLGSCNLGSCNLGNSPHALKLFNSVNFFF